MSPITAQQAWDATDPSQSDDQRKEAAQRIMAGVAANDAFINSRTELEQYVLHARGGQVVSHDDLNKLEDGQTADSLPTGSAAPTVEGGETAQLSPGATPGQVDAEGTAVEEPADAEVASDPGDSKSDADKLRDQLRAAGIEPEA